MSLSHSGTKAARSGPAVARPERPPSPEQEEAHTAHEAERRLLHEAVSKAQKGDERAFRTVYETLQPRLFRYARALVGATEAEDVLSDSWLQIARDLHKFRGDVGHFHGWCSRIVRNRAVDHIRWHKRRPTATDDISTVMERPAPDDTSELALDMLGTERALTLVAQLPRQQAQAVTLLAVVGLDAKRAAGILGKRVGAVRTAAHRGIRTLSCLMTDTAYH
ncbi:sigma-70 family RNA polymerase sigma factor [Streptomyces sp. SID8379]|uniref:RNA polymerase sigma factor n=1 Tax=unclassified Streptomyces TaxID=2593676 RepID=UPI00037F693D|nr:MULTISPECIES: RNA polymerase sigma factor [unclassified Streptomyces]MYW65268.1 sigma-70 family RNA polymerase sigma factor [Streptomyces sp. SID8379]